MGLTANLPTLALILLVLVLVNMTTATGESTKAADVSKAFKLDFNGLTMDPSAWSTDVKGKVVKTACATAYVFYLGASPPLCLFWFILHYSLVKLDWVLVFFSSATFYGYRRGGKLILVGGALASYAYAFGAFSL